MTSAIKSRPRYADRLTLDPSGRLHVIVALGAASVEPIAACFSQGSDGIGAPVRVLSVGAEIPLGIPVSHYPDEAGLLRALRGILEISRMGLRLYAVGPEAFLWSIDHVAIDYGFGKGEVIKFPAGSLARRVYCSHCKTVSDGVVANLHPCPGCGTILQVRDHFSRRLGAFMGVKADAELPGILPETIELFP
jgi:predicted RNA-binding Zn-ribbon protein involved in translation (DUF1610 family)